jgi:hypothetical protein
MPSPAQPFASDILAGGSREKSKSGYGQNGDDSASSLTPGQSKPPIPNVSPPQPSKELIASRGGDEQDKLAHRVPREEHAPISHGLSARNVDSGSPGGTVPKTLDYAKKN